MSLLNVTVVRTTISLFLSLMWNTTTTKNNLKKYSKNFSNKKLKLINKKNYIKYN